MNQSTAAAGVIFGCGLLGFGCAVGSGDGEAKGLMFIDGCGGGYGNAGQQKLFDLNPTFFAAEPVEDIRENATQNRLTMRLQRHGGAFEVNDVLQFDIVNSHEVARCVRGRHKPDVATGNMVPDYRTDTCWWPTPAGPPRVRVGPNDFLRVTFSPFQTCRSANRPYIIGVAVPCKPIGGRSDCIGLQTDKWESYVEFKEFGGAEVRPEIPAETRDEISENFKVNFGKTIQVSRFVLEFTDDHLLVLPTGVSTQTKPFLTGHMEGWFGFDFDRGRAVQTFP